MSGCLFTLVLAGALQELRITLAIEINRPNPPLSALMMPLKHEYADDVDFNDESEENLRFILSQATEILSKWNLFVNQDKTEFVRVFLAQRGETDADGKLLSGNESWRRSITLGSMICSKADVNPSPTTKKHGTRRFKIPLSKRLLLYMKL